MLIRAFILVSLLTMGIALTAERQPAHPNIIVILADDLGYGDLGCFGCTDIPTPNIDRLAHDGVKFTQAYAYPVCSPTRAALLTGCYAEKLGIKSPLMGHSVPKFGEATLVAKMLHDAGYVTGLVGKWHLGYEGDLTPTRMGFDEFFGHLGGKIDYFKHTDSTQKGKHDLWEGTEEVFREGYSTDLFSDRALKFIRDHATQPFFLYVAYNAPHYSVSKGDYQAPDTYLKKFGVGEKVNGTRGAYAAMVNCMDDGIGRILHELKTQKLEEKTLVLFCSDNGAEAAGSNKPFSGGKHSTLEGGIRVPWVARWPGVITPGTVRKDVVHMIDITPTLLALTGTQSPPEVKFDGINIWSAFIGKEAVPERPVFFSGGLLMGKWKLRAGKLFDLEADPGESHDVSAANPDVLEKLSKLLPEKTPANKKKK